MMISETRAILAVNPVNEKLKYEKIISSMIKENEPIFYMDTGLKLPNPFEQNERLEFVVKTIDSQDRKIEQLEKENKELKAELKELKEQGE